MTKEAIIEETCHDMSAFKAAYLRFRRRPDQPDRCDDLSEMVDFGQSKNDPRIIRLLRPPDTSDVYHGPMYGLRDFPGFLYAPQALTLELQHSLSYQAVSVYCEAPHRTNIDNLSPKPHEIMNNNKETQWDLWKEQRDKNSRKNKETSHYYRTFDKLSWATIGHHYDWTSRSYPLEMNSSMPPELSHVATLFARTAAFHNNDDTAFSFNATAAIVNFYNIKSNMGGHRDDGELALDKPIVSVSMGRPAVFLLGGLTKDEGVVPMLVRAGDVMILGGASRLHYHSMARLLPGLPPAVESVYPSTQVGCCSGMAPVPAEDRMYLEEFLSSHRININVRQVFPDTRE